jgi:ABC-type glycerol-3-phosphate transport system permease component
LPVRLKDNPVTAQSINPPAVPLLTRQPLTRRSTRQTVILTTLAIMASIIFIWPFISVLAWTFNDFDATMNSLLPIPGEFTLKSYQLMVTRYHLQYYLWNSIWTAAVITALSTFLAALAGYALAKFQFPGRNIAFGIILAVMLLPLGTMLVPMFIVMRDLSLVNNYWGLILPTVGGGAFNIFLMRQFMLGIPTEMLEAARMDGANEFDTFLRIVVPNSKAAIGVVATLVLRGAWNSLLWPQIILSNDSMQLILPAIARVTQNSVDPYRGYVTTAAAFVAAIVPLLLYSYSQKFFVETLAGAIKG